jgi:hypothetical protein
VTGTPTAQTPVSTEITSSLPSEAGAVSKRTREPLLVVAGLTKKNLQPRVWDPASPYHLPQLRAVMISYADFHRRRSWREAAMAVGLRAYLGVPDGVQIFLDNGAFALLSGGAPPPVGAYEVFVSKARPDWYPIPLDYIPTPAMDGGTQQRYFEQTMAMNRAYAHDGFVPVVHVGPCLEQFVQALAAEPQLAGKRGVALGGIVPNLLRRSQARPYDEVLAALRQMRAVFGERKIHVFGMGGTATLHLAALLCIDSVDSSGWRNRAARGLIQLPGTGDRIVTQLGNWRGRQLSPDEAAILDNCGCPPCQKFGGESIRARGLPGASHRATHNLWVLLQESHLIEEHLQSGTYAGWYRDHLDNTIYGRLIDHIVKHDVERETDEHPGSQSDDRVPRRNCA